MTFIPFSPAGPILVNISLFINSISEIDELNMVCTHVDVTMLLSLHKVPIHNNVIVSNWLALVRKHYLGEGMEAFEGEHPDFAIHRRRGDAQISPFFHGEGGGGGNVHIMSNTNCQINESSSNTTIEHI